MADALLTVVLDVIVSSYIVVIFGGCGLFMLRGIVVTRGCPEILLISLRAFVVLDSKGIDSFAPIKRPRLLSRILYLFLF